MRWNLLLLCLCLCPAGVSAVEVQWIAEGDGVWTNPENWSSFPLIPGPADDVTIDPPGSQIQVGLVSVLAEARSVRSTGSFFLKESRLSVYGGDSEINGLFEVESGAVSANGTDTELRLNRFVATEQAGIYASDGASVTIHDLLPSGELRVESTSGGAIAFADADGIETGYHPVFLADGPNSRIELSSAPSVRTRGVYTEFTARAGGRIELGRHLSGDRINFAVYGAHSEMETSATETIDAEVTVSVGEGGKLAFENPIADAAYRAIYAYDVGSHFDTRSIRSLSSTRLLAGQAATLNFPSLTSYRDDRGNSAITAAGDGARLDLSNLQEFHGSATYVEAMDGGRVDIGGDVTGEVEFFVDGSTSMLNLDQVTEIESGRFYFVARNGGRVDVPGGASFRPNFVVLRAESGGFVRAPALDHFEVDSSAAGVASGAGSVVDLSPIREISGGIGVEARNGGRVIIGGRVEAIGLIADGAESQIDVSALSEVHKYGNVAAYNGARIVFPPTSSDFRLNSLQVVGQGSLVDLGNVKRFYDTQIIASGGGLIVVPNTVDVTDPFRVSFLAVGQQSRIDLTAIERLQSRFPTNPQIGFTVNEGVIEARDLVNVGLNFDHVGGGRVSAVDVKAYFLSMPKSEAGKAAELQLSGSLSIVSASPVATNTVGGTLAFAGGGLQSLELAGRDFGDGDGYFAARNRSGNFGIARLLVGSAEHRTRLNLVDVLNNGSHSGDQREALYIFDYADGLKVGSGSVLHLQSVLGTMHAYTRIDGEYVDLNSLFPGPNSTIPFDQGFISNVLLGDFDLDGAVNAVDIELLRTAVRDGSADEEYDLNLSGTVDADDLQELLADVLFTMEGDGNLDGNVDLADLNLVRNYFGGAADWSTGDFDGDGAVGLADLNSVRNNFGYARAIGGVVPLPVVPVPEQGSLRMLVIGLLAGICGTRSRFRRRCGRGFA